MILETPLILLVEVHRRSGPESPWFRVLTNKPPSRENNIFIVHNDSSKGAEEVCEATRN